MRGLLLAAVAALLNLGAIANAEPPKELPASHYNIARFIVSSMGERFDVEASLQSWINYYALELDAPIRYSEFERPKALEDARQSLHEAAATAPKVVVWSSWLTFGEYDFQRKAFPVKEFTGFGTPILGVSWHKQAPSPNYELAPTNIEGFQYVSMDPDRARDFVANELRGGIKRRRKAEVKLELVRAVPSGTECKTIQAYCRVEVRIVGIDLFDQHRPSFRVQLDGKTAALVEAEPATKKSRWRALRE